MVVLSDAQASLTCEFLAGGGKMGELIRSKDWSKTPLGPIEKWPQSLRTTVSLCLASNFPINLIWGRQHIQIYNDGYRPICAGKHPKSLGEDFTKTWASAWEILDEAFRDALAGQTSFLENCRMFLDRNGYLEETFFTFSLSPIRDESGEIGGLFHPVTETTAQMLSQRRTRALQELALRTGQSKSVEEACRLSAQALADCQFDLPFALIYFMGENARHARLAAHTYLSPGSSASPELVDLDKGTATPWPLAEVARSGVTATVNGLADILGPLKCGPYPEPPNAALVLPIWIAGIEVPAGFLVAGVSPRLPFTDEYRAFFDLLAAALSAAIVNARSYDAERQRAERLAELDRVKTEFFSNVSHEFRTPLTLMIGPLEEMLSEFGDQLDIKRQSIALVHRNSLRLLRLVNTLLDFSRLEANRAEAVFESIDLSSLTCDLSSLFRSATEKAGLALAMNCRPLSEDIYVDRDMWEKILLNLISNAFKFTFQGSISIALEECDDHVKLSVSDTGTGIPASELPNLFKRFHRVQGAHGRSYEGSGIGLALVEELVKLHCGTVWAESQLGHGTTFYVTIPKGFQHLPAERVRRTSKVDSRDLAGNTFLEEALRWLPDEQSGRNETTEDPRRSANSGRLKRILLADDNADMRRYIEGILGREFEVEAVPDGEQALRAIEKLTPDLVLTDVMMPKLDGFGLLRELRKSKATQTLPIIMLSARAGEEARVEGIESGADDYLVKPFNARELLARVRLNLELTELRQGLSREEEKRRGAEEIERQWRLFDTALSHTPDSIYIFDLGSRLVYANSASLERWHRSLDEVIGKSVTALSCGPEPGAAFGEHIEEVLRRRVPVRDEVFSVDTGGNMRFYDYILIPVFSQSGELEAVAGSTRDITQLKQANRALSEANAEMEQFVYSASHDLKAPLRVIDNASQWLEEDLHEHLTSETRESMSLLRGRVRRMEKLLDDLLGYAQIGRATDRRYAEIIAGDVLMADVTALLQCHNFTITISPEFAAVQVQRMPLQQILMNLLDNAIKHHDRTDGCIGVKVVDKGAQYIFEVKDDGPGIPAQFHDQVFKMFKTLRPRDQVEGSGMGLSIVRKNIEVFGGTIELESEGRGTTFRFTWPKEQRIEVRGRTDAP